jgi:hypothetical protein
MNPLSRNLPAQNLPARNLPARDLPALKPDFWNQGSLAVDRRPRAPRQRLSIVAAGAVLLVAWLVAAADYGMTGHMAAHMAAVSLAAPLLAIGLAGSRCDLAARWPTLVAPLAMSLVELAAVWGWHLPAARAWVAASATGLMLQAASRRCY